MLGYCRWLPPGALSWLYANSHAGPWAEKSWIAMVGRSPLGARGWEAGFRRTETLLHTFGLRFDRVSLAGRQEQVLFEAVLAGVEVVVAAAHRE